MPAFKKLLIEALLKEQPVVRAQLKDQEAASDDRHMVHVDETASHLNPPSVDW
jgi:hypothetical protein